MRQDVLDKTREHPRGTAARILDAAEHVFAEVGYAGASTREIARRARVPFGALHYHWGSKKELREAVVARLVDRTRDTVIRHYVPGGSPGEILDHMCDAFVEVLATNRNATRLMYRHALEPRDARIEKMWSDLSALGEGMLRETGLGTRIDGPVAILAISSAFLAAVADEPGQRVALGASVFSSRAARDRLRIELRRLARATFLPT